MKWMKSVWPILLIGLLCGCAGHKKQASDYAQDTAALEEIFPVLEASEVTAFRYQDSCKVLSYTRGSFANPNESTCIYAATETPEVFDIAAEDDLENIWQQVKSTRSGVYIISDIQFDAADKLIYGEFDCSGGFTRQRYVFDPGYTLPEDLPGERWHTRIDDDWYYINEDWN